MLLFSETTIYEYDRVRKSESVPPIPISTSYHFIKYLASFIQFKEHIILVSSLFCVLYPRLEMFVRCLCFFSILLGCHAFPDGAPIDVCVKPRPNQPNHGQARPQPHHTNPYQIFQSAEEYRPGTQITGAFRDLRKICRKVILLHKN